MTKLTKQYINLLRNLPGNEDWEGSFYERLVECAVWDEKEFWKLHLDLTDIARDMASEILDRDLAIAVVRLYIKIATLISAHYDSNDVFHIRNLNDFQISDYKERLDLAVVGVFSGDVLDEKNFDLRSPLLD